jgi:glutathione S-transferase
MPRITLYGPIGAPFVTKVRGALALKKLPFELVEPRGPEDYKRWSPETGLLPVIDVDERRVPDSGRILDFLDVRFPEPPLVAGDPKVADSQRRLERWVEEAFMFYWVHYLRALVERGEGVAEPEAGGRRRRGLLRRGKRPTASSALGIEFAQRLDDVVNFLGDRPFFYADRVSRADLAVYSFLRRLPEIVGQPLTADLAERPELAEHLLRVEQATGLGRG